MEAVRGADGVCESLICGSKLEPNAKVSSSHSLENVSAASNVYKSNPQDEMTDPPVTHFSNLSTHTDICCRADTAEVKLVSLIEEQIPYYKLRAHTLTEFCGYENEDWSIQTPVVRSETDIPVSQEVVEETLNYFGADRLSQIVIHPFGIQS